MQPTSHSDDFVRLQQRIASHIDSSRNILIVGIDGPGAAGKTTLARALAAPHGNSVSIVHTDDIAWHHSFFAWHELLTANIVAPCRAGHLPIRYRPPGWIAKGRDGSITVPRSTRCLIIEGTGVAHRSVADGLDVIVWVESGVDVREERTQQRLHDGTDTADFVAEWNLQEQRYLQRDRPWLRATFVISGEGHSTNTS